MMSATPAAPVLDIGVSARSESTAYSGPGT